MSVPLAARGAVLEAGTRAPLASLDDLAPDGGVLVIVPHPDDEALGCGRALAACAVRRRLAGIVLLTDGEGSHPASRAWPPKRLVARRRAEMERSLAILVGNADVPILRLGLPDGEVDANALPPSAIERAHDFARDVDARCVWASWPGDPHCDHEAAGRLGEMIAGTLGVPLRYYVVWGRFEERPVPAGLHRFEAPERDTAKREAIRAHASQLTDLIADDPDAFRMPSELQRHFEDAPELFVLPPGCAVMDGTGERAAQFDALYARDPDPWDFETSAYEAAKRRATIAALGGAGFDRALEVGCATGVLTRDLAAIAKRLIAVDCSARALDRARGRLGADAAERIALRRMEVPREWPEGAFDLVILSEVLYFLSVAEIREVARRTRESLTPGGTCLLVNWTGPNDLPVNGEEAVALFENESGLFCVRRTIESRYRIDLYEAP